MQWKICIVLQQERLRMVQGSQRLLKSFPENKINKYN